MTKRTMQSTRTALIEAVKTPLSFFTLVILVIEGLLVYLVRRAEGVTFTVVVIALIALMFTLVIIVALLQFRGRAHEYRLTTDKEIKEYKYDVFLSIPMAALKDREYPESRELALEISAFLKEYCRMKSVMYAGSEIDSKHKFDPHDVAVIDDLDAITNSKFFVMIYPKRVTSSVLFEAGIALALGKECRYFVKNRAHLPFLLKQAEQAFTSIRIHEYKTTDDIKKVLKTRNCFMTK